MSPQAGVWPAGPRIGLTGGIACGKSLFLKELRKHGFRTLDADDIVHSLVPAEERRRLARLVFADAGARLALEAKIHPVVRARIAAFFDNGADACALGGEGPRVAAVPLLFEAGWANDFDMIVCVVSPREMQIERMVATRGWSRTEAEARIAAQMDTAEKATRSHVVVVNDGTPDDVAVKAAEFAKRIYEAHGKTI